MAIELKHVKGKEAGNPWALCYKAFVGFRHASEHTGSYVTVIHVDIVDVALFLFRVGCFHTMTPISIDWEPTTFSCL